MVGTVLESVRNVGGGSAVVIGPGPHRGMGVGTHQSSAFKLATVQMKAHPARHVGGGGSDASRRPIGTELHVALHVQSARVTLVAGGQRLALDGVELSRRGPGGGRHAQRIEDFALQEFAIGFAADILHHLGGQRRAPVRVRGAQARRIDALGLVLAQQLGQAARIIVGHRIQTHAVFEAGAVVHQLAHGHRHSKRLSHAHILEIAVDVGIQIELPAFHQHHHGGPDEGLGHRADAEQALVGHHRPGSGQSGLAKALFQPQGIILDYGQRQRSKAVLSPQAVDHALDIALQLGPLAAAENLDRRPVTGCHRIGQRRNAGAGLGVGIHRR